MKVSIITVAYNSAETIEDTILSVIQQNYSDIEYIIVDGGSKDNTLAICNKYKDKIAVLVSEKDNGIYDAMNKGLRMATGEIIGILNSDDVYADHSVIHDVVSKIKETGSEALYADLVYVDNKDLKKVKRYWKSGSFKKSKFKFGWMPPHPTVFIKKALYTKFGDFSTQLHSAADYELMLRFFYKNNVVPTYLNRVITLMRMGGESNASVKNRYKANQEDRMAWKMNEIKPFPFTLTLKPIRKIPQFILRKKLK